LVIGTEGLWDFIQPDELNKILNNMTIGQRETHGEIISYIWKNILEVSKHEGQTLKDTTVIVSSL
jgi:hypothetical protein